MAEEQEEKPQVQPTPEELEVILRATARNQQHMAEVARRLALVTSSGAGIVALLALAFGGSKLFDFATSQRADPVVVSLSSQVGAIQKELASQGDAARAVASRLDAMVNLSENSPHQLQLATIRAELKTLRKRLSDLEEAIVANPGNALALPLLRQDVENLRVSYQKDITASGREIDRIYDQNKWFVGLMFTMAIALIGLAVSNFVQARRKGG